MPRQAIRCAHAIFALSAVALAAPLGGHDSTIVSGWQGDRIALIDASGDDDDDLMLYDSGPMLLMRSHSRDSDNSDWLKFETDSCGLLQRVDSRHSLLQQSALSDDGNEDDESDDPSDRGRAIVGQWLSEHAEIAVINDAVDKSCDDLSIENDDPSPEMPRDATAFIA